MAGDPYIDVVAFCSEGEVELVLFMYLTQDAAKQSCVGSYSMHFRATSNPSFQAQETSSDSLTSTKCFASQKTISSSPSVFPPDHRNSRKSQSSSTEFKMLPYCRN